MRNLPHVPARAHARPHVSPSLTADPGPGLLLTPAVEAGGHAAEAAAAGRTPLRESGETAAEEWSNRGKNERSNRGQRVVKPRRKSGQIAPERVVKPRSNLDRRVVKPAGRGPAASDGPGRPPLTHGDRRRSRDSKDR